MSKKPDKPLGEAYYRQFFENDPFSPKMREIAEKRLPQIGVPLYGQLKIVFLNAEDDLDQRVSVATFNHREGRKDVLYAMMTASELGISTIRPVMKAGHANALYTKPFHKLGGVGVGRGTGDAQLLSNTLGHLAEHDFSPAFFTEGFRVRPGLVDANGEPLSTRKIHGVKPGAPRLSLQADLPYIPIAMAGTAKDDVIDAKRVPIVACVAPILFPTDFRHYDDPLRELTHAALESQQSALDQAYFERTAYELGTKSL